MSTPTRPRRRWPLLVIGTSAGMAVWSGWVGLGNLVGFGIVHPLPGIADSVTINTAITLPVGVEAYAMYALSVATTTAQITRAARRFAWISSVVALVLGMVGQVAYHLMSANHITTAPWPIVAGVSCLPVLVLGVASVLWHLAGQADEDVVTPVTSPVTPVTGPVPAAGDDRDQVPTVTVLDTDHTGHVTPTVTPVTAAPVTPVTGDLIDVTPVTDDPSDDTWSIPDDLSSMQVTPTVTPVTDTRAAVAAMREADPDLTGAEIARRLGVTRQTVARHLRALTD